MMNPGMPSRNAAACQVVAQEGERRVADKVPHRRPASSLVHLASRVGRIAIDGLQVIGDVAVGEVLELSS